MPVENNKLPKIVVIAGPTASGKTGLAVKIAKKFNGEIVSADSRQIYKGMNIGTAKPTAAEMKAAKHYLVGIKNPDEEYTAAEFKKDALAAINKIIKKGKLPILAGGTGLYIKSVVDNLDIPAVKADWALRKKLENKIKKNGLESVYRELIKLDPEAAHIVDAKNPRRIVRALEIAIITGKPFSAQRKKGERLFDCLEIGIKLPGKELEKRINKRVDKMIKAGLVEEAKKLVKKYGGKQTAFDAIGYKEIISFLKKEISLAEAAALIKKNTRAFAKRQMTWFKKGKNIKWIRKESEALKLVDKFLKER